MPVYVTIATFTQEATLSYGGGRLSDVADRPMHDENDPSDEGPAGSRLQDGYRSPRRPKLRAATPRPPRLPDPGEEYKFDEFGLAAEDGLRMLAALETMPSLEPDFGEDLAAEAAVTIVERRGAAGLGGDLDENAAPSLSARLGELEALFDGAADGEAASLGPIEEATVEIVEIKRDTENGFEALASELEPPRRSSRKPNGRP